MRFVLFRLIRHGGESAAGASVQRPTPERPCPCWNRPRPRVRVEYARLNRPDRPIWQGISPSERVEPSIAPTNAIDTMRVCGRGLSLPFQDAGIARTISRIGGVS